LTAGSERLVKRRFEAVPYVQPSPAQAIAPEHNGMPAASPFGAMLLLSLLTPRTFALELVTSLSVCECENKIMLGQIKKTFRVKQVFH